MKPPHAAFYLIVVLHFLPAHCLIAGEFFTTPGKHTSPTGWTVEDHQGKGVTFTRAMPLGSVGVTPKFVSQEGWFIFVQDKSHVWAFDGGRSVLLCEATPEKGTVYDTPNLPYAPPKEVLDRLPEAVRIKFNAKSR